MVIGRIKIISCQHAKAGRGLGTSKLNPKANSRIPYSRKRYVPRPPRHTVTSPAGKAVSPRGAFAVLSWLSAARPYKVLFARVRGQRLSPLLCRGIKSSFPWPSASPSPACLQAGKPPPGLPDLPMSFLVPGSDASQQHQAHGTRAGGMPDTRSSTQLAGLSCSTEGCYAQLAGELVSTTTRKAPTCPCLSCSFCPMPAADVAYLPLQG